MKLLILALILIVATTPAYALTHQQKEARAKHHAHLHMLHKEHKVLSMWMAQAEKDCAFYTQEEYRACYRSTLKTLHEKSHIVFSPETQETFDTLVHGR